MLGFLERAGTVVSGWGRFEINQLLFADIVLVADSVTQYAKKRTLRVNVGKRKTMRCSRYVNVCRLHVRLNGKPFEEMNNCFSTWFCRWQWMEDEKWM